MSIDNFPTEILERILNLLSLEDFECCRLVNRRWYDLSRVLLELRWRKTCQAEFPEAWSEARRKSQYKLSWEQLHRSLSLGPHMSEAKITGQSKPLPKLKNCNGGDDIKRQFMVLNNGLIGTPIYSKKLNEDKGNLMDNEQKASTNEKCLMNIPCCNAVLYLDIDTLAERHLETYEFEFNKYAETDDMVVFRSCQGASCKLVIGYKVEGKPTKLHTVGDMRMHGTHYTEFFIVNDAVYYQDDENEILTKVSPKTDTEGEKVPEIKPITKFSVKNDESLKEYHDDKMTIIAIAQVNENTVNVLTDNPTHNTTDNITLVQLFFSNQLTPKIRIGMIYSLNILTEEFSIDWVSDSDDSLDRRVVHNRLRKSGFDFADERIFAWLSKFIALTKMKKTVVHRHDKIVILGNTRKTLFIYSNPFKYTGIQLYLYTDKPTLKIDLKNLDNVQFDKKISPQLNKISQIDAIPTRNGLKIVVLVAETMVIVNLIHDKQPECF